MAQPTLKKIYSDIDLAFTRTPGRNDVAMSYDETAVIRAIKYLLLTKPFEKPFEPDFGSRLNALLFEPVDYMTGQMIKEEVINTIRLFETRVQIDSLDVVEKPDDNAYEVTLRFYVLNNTTPTVVNLTLERLR